jgi:hypothetical protein
MRLESDGAVGRRGDVGDGSGRCSRLGATSSASVGSDNDPNDSVGSASRRIASSQHHAAAAPSHAESLKQHGPAGVGPASPVDSLPLPLPSVGQLPGRVCVAWFRQFAQTAVLQNLVSTFHSRGLVSLNTTTVFATV